MIWLDIIMRGVSTIVDQWMNSSEEDRKAIEARAMDALRDMIADRNGSAAIHSSRTLLTLAEIDAARGQK